ncbi:MAG: fructose-bisphosphate aldolase [Gammaproteobacteria bacterium]|nr:MAG: fructose-bisphosphate aldolase [Gammaproteobacteria bacterium]
MAELNRLLEAAREGGYAVPCFNVFGIEDVQALVAAAEAEDAPVILAVNREMVAFAGRQPLADYLVGVAAEASVPVCVHLDHCEVVDEVKRAVDAGFPSVMFDGSQRSLEENCRCTREVADYAHAAGAGVEGEIGSVPYRAGSVGREHVQDRLATVDDAARFSAESGADAIAVAVGNCHRLIEGHAIIDHELFAELRDVVAQPLVIHGASGIRGEDQQRLTRAGAAKFNIGTSIRRVLTDGLREVLAEQPDLHDRLRLFQAVMPRVEARARDHFQVLGASGHAVDSISRESETS